MDIVSKKLNSMLSRLNSVEAWVLEKMCVYVEKREETDSRANNRTGGC